MALAHWQERGGQFVLVHPRIEARIDPAKPGRGLGGLVLDGESVAGAEELLAVRWFAAREPAGETPKEISFQDASGRGGCVLRDCWCCGGDLLAEYVPEFGEDTSLTIRWRLSPAGSVQRDSLSVDILFSLETLREPHFQRLCVTSRLRLLPVYLARQGERGPELLPAQVSGTLPAGASLLACLAGDRWWYHELIHPADLVAGGIAVAEESPAEVDELSGGWVAGTQKLGTSCRSWYRLFADAVERGIIFRARVRATFWPGSLLPDQAVKAYEEFANRVPPLGD